LSNTKEKLICDEDFDDIVINELDDEPESKDHLANIHKHMYNVIFSEEFGQHESIDTRFEKEMDEEEKKFDGEEEKREETQEILQGGQDPEATFKRKVHAMKLKKLELESKLLKEQYILSQSYHTDHEDMEKFNIYSIKDLLEEG
jgi:hypothetical protein